MSDDDDIVGRAVENTLLGIFIFGATVGALGVLSNPDARFIFGSIVGLLIFSLVAGTLARKIYNSVSMDDVRGWF